MSSKGPEIVTGLQAPTLEVTGKCLESAHVRRANDFLAVGSYVSILA